MKYLKYFDSGINEGIGEYINRKIQHFSENVNGGFEEDIDNKIPSSIISRDRRYIKSTAMDVRDVFQDLLDEYSFVSGGCPDIDNIYGYHFNLENSDYLYLDLFFPRSKCDFESTWDDFIGRVSRLERMGYKVEAQSLDDSSDVRWLRKYNNNISSSKFVNSWTKYIEYSLRVYYPTESIVESKYFESTEVDYHIQEIEDIFLDVKDEIGLDKYHPSIPNGLLYMIGSGIIDGGLGIQLLIVDIKDWMPQPDRFGELRVVKDLESRLRNIGYTFKRTNSSYYEIIIDWTHLI